MNEAKISYTPRTLSAAADVGLTNIFAALKAGALRSRRLGKKHIIFHDDAMAWLKSLPDGRDGASA